MSRLIGRTINPLVGLAAEAYQHNKDKKAGRSASSSSQPSDSLSNSKEASSAQSHQNQDLPPAYNDVSKPRSHSPSKSPATSDDESSDEGDLTDNDEDDWARDATQAELSQSHSKEPMLDVKKYIADFFNRHPDHLRNAPFPPLPCPVIIPQRRPSAKSRGFVRAYAPILADSGIDAPMFIDFLNGFERAIKGQGAFTAFNLAVMISTIAESIASSSVEPISHLVALAVHVSVEAGRRVYESVETNKYLDQMNTHLFKPHGLYAMIMSYQPHSSHVSHVADMDKNTLSAISAHEGGRSKVHSASGHSTNDQIPACAPLIFPELEKTPDEEKANAFKRAMVFVGDYQDKRAQASWAHKNPESKLNVPGTAPGFASSMGDPNHAAYQGGIINLLSGGRAGGLKQERRQMKRERRHERGLLRAERRGVEYTPRRREQRRAERLAMMGARPDDQRSVREVRREYRQSRKERGLTPVSFVKRTLGENVLYLMVVNMPSDEEMAWARETAKKRGIFS